MDLIQYYEDSMVAQHSPKLTHRVILALHTHTFSYG